MISERRLLKATQFLPGSLRTSPLGIFTLFFFFLFFLFMAQPMAYGSSQARGHIGAAAMP